MPMTAKDMVKLLQKHGFLYVSSNGSHWKMRNAKTGETVIVPMHNKDLKKGTEESILKKAGLK